MNLETLNGVIEKSAQIAFYSITKKIVKMFDISVNFKDIKKANHILKSSEDIESFCNSPFLI